VGEQWSDLDVVTQEQLLRWAKRTARSPEEFTQLQADIVSGLGFSPLSGKVVALGLYDIERDLGVVYYVGDGSGAETVEGVYTYKERTESELLREFWEGAKHYDTFVTFNGRQFDVPFLMHRSGVAQIRPSVNLLEGRYPYQQKHCRHVDLLDELTFFGAMSRRPSLHMFCRAYGIKSPKGTVDGDAVAKLAANRQFFAIAQYSSQDVIATTELYKVWQAFFKPNP